MLRMQIDITFACRHMRLLPTLHKISQLVGVLICWVCCSPPSRRLACPHVDDIDTDTVTCLTSNPCHEDSHPRNTNVVHSDLPLFFGLSLCFLQIHCLYCGALVRAFHLFPLQSISRRRSISPTWTKQGRDPFLFLPLEPIFLPLLILKIALAPITITVDSPRSNIPSPG